MTGRDRIVVMVLAALVLLGLGWIGVVSPERGKASKLAAKVSSAEAALTAADGKLAEAKKAESGYRAAYADIVSLGEAVPADSEVPSLMYQVEHASSHAHVSFQSITAGGASSSSAPAAASTESSSAEGSGGTGTASAFQVLPFTFTFQGTFKDLYHVMARLQGFASSGGSGAVKVSGRLLTVQSLALNPGASTEGGSNQLTGTVSASAYVLPAGEPVAGGATPAGPAGAAGSEAGSEAPAAGAPAATPAIVRAP